MFGNIIELKNISKNYWLTKNNKVTALNNVNLDIKKGDFIAITGPSGSGKSTLLNMIGLLDRPDKNNGSLIINNHNITDLNQTEFSVLRRETIGFVFQTFNLLPKLSAYENVLLPMRYAKVKRQKRKQQAIKLLELVGLTNRIKHKPPELSGGERQRVAIARALTNSPQILLADEPTGNLDTKSGTEIMNLLKNLNHEKNMTLIVVTHDPEIAAQANKIIKLKDGQIC